MLSSKLLSEIRGLRHGFQAAEDRPRLGLRHCHQIHGDRVVIATDQEPADTAVIDADGLLTQTSELPVAVQTADCLPVLFGTRDAVAVAAVHAGWRGLQKGILKKAVERLAAIGVKPNDLIVAIGPGIGQCCYEVDEATIAAFEAAWGKLWEHEHEKDKPWRLENRAPRGRPQSPGTNNLWINLDRIARLQLESFSVPASQIEDVGGCTYCASPGFVSYRRGCHENRTTKPLVGRQWSWITIGR